MTTAGDVPRRRSQLRPARLKPHRGSSARAPPRLTAAGAAGRVLMVSLRHRRSPPPPRMSSRRGPQLRNGPRKWRLSAGVRRLENWPSTLRHPRLPPRRSPPCSPRYGKWSRPATTERWATEGKAVGRSRFSGRTGEGLLRARTRRAGATTATYGTPTGQPTSSGCIGRKSARQRCGRGTPNCLPVATGYQMRRGGGTTMGIGGKCKERCDEY